MARIENTAVREFLAEFLGELIIDIPTVRLTAALQGPSYWSS